MSKTAFEVNVKIPIKDEDDLDPITECEEFQKNLMESISKKLNIPTLNTLEDFSWELMGDTFDKEGNLVFVVGCVKLD